MAHGVAEQASGKAADQRAGSFLRSGVLGASGKHEACHCNCCIGLDHPLNSPRLASHIALTI